MLAKKIFGISLLLVLSLVRDLSGFFWRPLMRFLWNFKSKRRSSHPRVLILKIKSLSEAVCLLPALHLLKSELKDSNVTLLSTIKIGPFLAKTKLVDRVENFTIGTIWQMMKASFMLVLDFEPRSLRSAVAASQMRTPVSVGFESKGQGRHFATDESMEFDLTKHVAENFWNLALLACESCGHSPTRDFKKDLAEVRQEVRTLLYENALKVIEVKLPPQFFIFHMGCGEAGWPRQWPEESWVALAKRLKTQYPQSEIWLTGQGEHEEKLAEKLVAAGCVSWVSRLSYEELFQVLTKAEKIYCIDSGMAHLAALMNDKVVTLMGPGNPQTRGPLWGTSIVKSQIECSPCLAWGHDYGCSDPVCMKSIELEKVYV